MAKLARYGVEMEGHPCDLICTILHRCYEEVQCVMLYSVRMFCPECRLCHLLARGCSASKWSKKRFASRLIHVLVRKSSNKNFITVEGNNREKEGNCSCGYDTSRVTKTALKMIERADQISLSELA